MIIRILVTCLVALALIAAAIPAWRHDRRRRRRGRRTREQQLLRTVNQRRHPLDRLGPADINRALAAMCRAQPTLDHHPERITR